MFWLCLYTNPPKIWLNEPTSPIGNNFFSFFFFSFGDQWSAFTAEIQNDMSNLRFFLFFFANHSKIKLNTECVVCYYEILCQNNSDDQNCCSFIHHRHHTRFFLYLLINFPNKNFHFGNEKKNFSKQKQ